MGMKASSATKCSPGSGLMTKSALDRVVVLTRGRQLRSTSTRNLLKCQISGPGRMEQSEENCGTDGGGFRLDGVASV
jgi:hypothetical protein